MDDRGDEWARIESLLGEFGKIDLEAAVRATEGLMCGAIGAFDDMVTLADSLPLATLQPEEVESPIRKVVTAADLIEAHLNAGDDLF